MIVDAHTHLFPLELAELREEYRLRDAWFGEAFASPRATFVTPDEMIASMDAAGIDASVIVGWPWRDAAHCNWHNAFLADVSVAHATRLPWMAIVNPVSPLAVRQVEDAVSSGAVAIGELNADAQGFDWRDTEVLRPFAMACIEADLPVMLHCSEPVGHLYPGKGSATPERVLAFASAFPELRIVAAHWGGGLPFYELMPEVKLALANVVYDTAASTYLYDFDVFASVVRIAGADRVLFASDYPVLKQRRFLERVRQTGLDPDALRQLLGTNAQRVFRLPNRSQSA
jgi:predicted TIM-barrel fold metal-dependent hydrolase